MSSIYERSFFSFCIAGAAALTLAVTASTALAQGHTGGKGSGHDAGSTSHDDGHSSHEGGSGKGKGGKGGREAGRGKGGGHQSLRDVFRDMEDEARSEAPTKGKKGKGASTAPKGKPSTTVSSDKPSAAKGGKGKKVDAKVAEDSDRPPHAGGGDPGPENKPGRPNLTPGIKKGDIYGDLFIVKRDTSGDPVLADGMLQVYYVVTAPDGTKTLECCVPYVDTDGDGVLDSLDDSYETAEVELGRLSVGRSPDRVLAAQLMDVIGAIEETIAAGGTITTDTAGRIVLTVGDEARTIDSPLANLALYKALMTDGVISYIEKDQNNQDVVVVVDLTAIGINVDGDENTMTETELLAAASFFAAASDKTIPITIDSVIYMNNILGITTADYSSLTEYSRDIYDITNVTEQPQLLLDLDGDGNYTLTSFNPLTTIPDFNSDPTPDPLSTVVGADGRTLNDAEAFAIAANDARIVIDFFHDPVTTTTN